MLIPSIDLMNGKAVKLVQGKEDKKKFEEDALAIALKYSIFPIVNVIDLDAAYGIGGNIDLIGKICKICDCYVGGGIRSVEKAYRILKLGAKKIIIGTKASKEFLSKLPKEKIIVAIDSKKGKIVDKGWKNETKKSPFERVKELKDYCSAFLYTYVDKEGLMEGIDYNTVQKLRKLTKIKLIYAGGISNMKEIKQIEKLDVDSVLGMSLYTRKLDLNETFIEILDFKKNNGLIPTIVQEESGQILMLAYSSRESLFITLKTRKCWYYSRRRNKLWQKGETSGNYQELIRIKVDCDKDTLLFLVKQKNCACHTGMYSCFNNKEFNLESLQQIINGRLDNPKKGSYTNKLLKNEKLLKQKILEESVELVNFKNKENLIWEIADLIYFMTVLMTKYNVKYNDIERELEIRKIKKNGII